jgi:hypothetical protein
MRICGDKDSGRTLALSGYPLGIACRSCGHRILLSARQLDAHEGDRRLLRRLPLLCRCGGCDLALYLLETAADVPAFLNGDTPQSYESPGGANSWRPGFLADGHEVG